MKNIYVGNLSYDTQEEGLESAFSSFGAVRRVSVIRDRETDRPRGFAFVEMEDDGEGSAAIEGMNGKELDGRTLTVNEARPRTDNQHGGGGGGRW